MQLTNRQKSIIYGIILGDGYLQKTGENNARLRIEHSLKQKEYIDWKYQELYNLFQNKPKKVDRIHPKSKKMYSYLRLQSHSSPFFGKLRRIFYNNQNKRKIDESYSGILNNNLTLAVWYMDDGYYYARDKSAHLYLPAINKKEINCLIKIFNDNYNLFPKYYCRKDKKACQLNFTGKDKDLLFKLINSYIISYFSYKLSFDPVTTEERE